MSLAQRNTQRRGVVALFGPSPIVASLMALGVITLGLMTLGACAVDRSPVTNLPSDPPPTAEASSPVPETTPPVAGTTPASSPTPTSPPQSPSPSPSPTPLRPTEPALVTAYWFQRADGISLAVVPASWVRNTTALEDVEQLWVEVLEIFPEADSPGMFDQLVCHAIGAPNKDSWNLEPWRPVVEFLDLLLTGCNP